MGRNGVKEGKGGRWEGDGEAESKGTAIIVIIDQTGKD
jgi:hypothetical protein